MIRLSSICSLVFLIACGENMGTEIRSFGQYQPVAEEQLYNQEFVDSVGEAAQLANNALIVYSQSGRVQQSVIANFPTDSSGYDMVLEVPAGKTKNMFEIMTKGLITGAGRRIKAWIYFKTDAANTTHLNIECGKHSAREADIENTSFSWQSIEVECDRVPSISLGEERKLRMFVEAGDSDVTVTIRSIAVHELGSNNAPSFLDLSSGVVGTADYPYSAAMSKIINDQIHSCYGFRMPRANVLNQCFADNYKVVSGSYDGDYRGMGMYIIRKGEGITSIDGKIRSVQGGTGQSKIYVGLYTTAGVLVDSTEITITTTTTQWNDWSFSGLSASETEYELRIDAKEHVSSITFVEIDNVFVTDDLSGGSEVNHVLPTKANVQPEDDVLAMTWNCIDGTTEQIWKRNRQILANDYRGRAERTGYNNEILSAGILHPTYNSKYFICRALISKPTDERKWQLDYDSGASSMIVGGVVTGGTSGSTGYLQERTQTGGPGSYSGTLYLTGVNGEFIDNETLTCTAGGSSSANGIMESITDLVVKMKLSIHLDLIALMYTNTAIFEQEIDITDKPHGSSFYLEFRIPIPSEYWNDYSNHSGFPMAFFLKTRSQVNSVDSDIDYTILHQASFYEEVQNEL